MTTLSMNHEVRTRSACLLKVQPSSLSLAFPGDYANEEVVKGKEDLKLIWWEQTPVLIIGRVMIERLITIHF